MAEQISGFAAPLHTIGDDAVLAASSLGIKDIVIYDTGAGKTASGKLSNFDEQSLKTCNSGEHLIDAGNNRHDVC